MTNSNHILFKKKKNKFQSNRLLYSLWQTNWLNWKIITINAAIVLISFKLDYKNVILSYLRPNPGQLMQNDGLSGFSILIKRSILDWQLLTKKNGGANKQFGIHWCRGE